LRFARPGTQGSISRSVRASRNQSRLHALVGDQEIGVRQRSQDGRGASIVAYLALGEQQDQWLAVPVTNGVQLGVQAAFGPSDTAGNSPFMSRPAAARWAFRSALSIITVSAAALSPARTANIRSKTPIRLQRMKLL
jgi:hypothetical protein